MKTICVVACSAAFDAFSTVGAEIFALPVLARVAALLTGFAKARRCGSVTATVIPRATNFVGWIR